MQEHERLLSAEESASIAGVSLDTIRLFEHCGLLDPVVKDNRTYFQEIDVQTLFYTKPKHPLSPEQEFKAEFSQDKDWGDKSQFETYENIQADFNLNGPEPVVPEPTIYENPPPSLVTKSTLEKTETKSETTAKPILRQVPILPPLTKQTSNDEISKTANVLNPSVDNSLNSTLNTKKANIEELPNTSLPSAHELIELNRGLREQIQILREERDWLRKRIEKLESRSEREQMLLMSESETVRQLISDTKSTKRRSFWQRALPWLGDES